MIAKVKTNYHKYTDEIAENNKLPTTAVHRNMKLTIMFKRTEKEHGRLRDTITHYYKVITRTQQQQFTAQMPQNALCAKLKNCFMLCIFTKNRHTNAAAKFNASMQ